MPTQTRLRERIQDRVGTKEICFINFVSYLFLITLSEGVRKPLVIYWNKSVKLRFFHRIDLEFFIFISFYFIVNL